VGQTPRARSDRRMLDRELSKICEQNAKKTTYQVQAKTMFVELCVWVPFVRKKEEVKSRALGPSFLLFIFSFSPSRHFYTINSKSGPRTSCPNSNLSTENGEPQILPYPEFLLISPCFGGRLELATNFACTGQSCARFNSFTS